MNIDFTIIVGGVRGRSRAGLGKVDLVCVHYYILPTVYSVFGLEGVVVLSFGRFAYAIG